MKEEQIKKYFEKIKEATGGDNTSNSEIIDYENGNSIDIRQIEEEYYKYIELQDEISDYIEDNDLDDVSDKNEIIEHYKDKIDEDLFEFGQAVLVNFIEYMTIKIKKQNAKQRKANMMFNKNGNGADTTRITIPVIWARKLGYTENDKTAIIKLKENSIEIIKEDSNSTRYATRDREAGNIIEYFASIVEARKAIQQYEESDKKEDIYEANFYEIYDTEAEEIIE